MIMACGFTTQQVMKANGIIIVNQEEEHMCTKMAVFTQDNGRMMQLMEREEYNIVMEMFMTVILLTK